MNIMIGDNRLENVAVKLSDVKVRDAYQAENQNAVQALDEKAQKAASDGVVLEISETGIDSYYDQKDAAEEVKALTEPKQQKQQQAVEERQQVQQENARLTAQKKILENINI